jgi:hypothetical protein
MMFRSIWLSILLTHLAFAQSYNDPNLMGREIFEGTGQGFGLTALKDNRGVSMDSLKIVQENASTFAGIYHQRIGNDKYCLALALANNLMARDWTFIKNIDCNYASQGDLQRLPDGRYLLAYEKNGADTPPFKMLKRPYIRIVAYRNLDALKAGLPEKVFDLPKTALAKADGTPNFRWIRYNGDLDSIYIEIGFHSRVLVGFKFLDRNYIGQLDSFQSYRSMPQGNINKRIDKTAKGNIGDRSFLLMDNHPYSIIEGQTRYQDWGSWKIYLFDETTQSVVRAGVIATPCGSSSIGNPNFSIVTIDGMLYLVGSVYVFSEGSKCGEAGTFLFGRRIPNTASYQNYNVFSNLLKTYISASLQHNSGYATLENSWSANRGTTGHMIYGPYDSSVPAAPLRVEFEIMITNASSLRNTDRIVNLDVRNARFWWGREYLQKIFNRYRSKSIRKSFT